MHNQLQTTGNVHSSDDISMCFSNTSVDVTKVRQEMSLYSGLCLSNICRHKGTLGGLHCPAGCNTSVQCRPRISPQTQNTTNAHIHTSLPPDVSYSDEIKQNLSLHLISNLKP